MIWAQQHLKALGLIRRVTGASAAAPARRAALQLRTGCQTGRIDAPVWPLLLAAEPAPVSWG